MMTNVDNINCDHIPYLIDELMKRDAQNVHVVPAITKKGRNEYIFLIDCKEEQIEDFAEFMAMETGTLGVRILQNKHYPFDYMFKKMELSFENGNNEVLWEGVVNFKIVCNRKGENISIRAEYEEIKDLTECLRNTGLNISLYEMKEMLEQRALEQFKDVFLNCKGNDPDLETPMLRFSVDKSIYVK